MGVIDSGTASGVRLAHVPRTWGTLRSNPRLSGFDPAGVVFQHPASLGVWEPSRFTSERSQARTSGLLELNDVVTFEAVHFGEEEAVRVEGGRRTRPASLTRNPLWTYNVLCGPLPLSAGFFPCSFRC